MVCVHPMGVQCTSLISVLLVVGVAGLLPMTFLIHQLLDVLDEDAH